MNENLNDLEMNYCEPFYHNSCFAIAVRHYIALVISHFDFNRLIMNWISRPVLGLTGDSCEI